MYRAVCGFYFSEDRERVVLIRKARPLWQSGRLNGVGGKVEEGEFAKDAMVREFEEETGVRVEDWDPFCIHEDFSHGVHVTFYRAFGDVDGCRTITDEEVSIECVANLGQLEAIQNLTWIVPMALDPSVREAHTVWR
jgi:8-oxo-dGTP diphosphatase